MGRSAIIADAVMPRQRCLTINLVNSVESYDAENRHTAQDVQSFKTDYGRTPRTTIGRQGFCRSGSSSNDFFQWCLR